MSIIESARRASERKRKLLEDKDTNSSKAKVVTNESKTTTNTKKSSIIESARRASQKKAETKRSYLEQSISVDTTNANSTRKSIVTEHDDSYWEKRYQEEYERLSVEHANEPVFPIAARAYEIVDKERKQEKYILDNQNKKYNDDFWGQFAANYKIGSIQEKQTQAGERYYETGDKSDYEYYKELGELAERIQSNNEDVFADDAVMSWLSKDTAGYLPQFFNRAVPQAIGMGVGGTAGALIGTFATDGVATIPMAKWGARIGATAASGIDSYDSMKASAFMGLMDMGVDEETARTAANDEAIIGAITEMGDTWLDFTKMGYGAVMNLIGKDTKKQAAKSGLKKLSSLLLKYGFNIEQERTEEGVQGAVSVANRRRAYAESAKKANDEIGQYGVGNIDLYNRPQYKQDNGYISTVNSISIEIDGETILIPTIAYDKNGNAIQLSDNEAVERYYETGEHLGKFKTQEEADEYAKRLHLAQEYYYTDLKDADYEQGKWGLVKDSAKVLVGVDFGTEDENTIAEIKEQKRAGGVIAAVMGLPGTAFDVGATAYIEKQNSDTRKVVDSVINAGLESDNQSEAHKKAEELKAKIDSGETITKEELVNVAIAVENEQTVQPETLEQAAREVVAKRNATETAKTEPIPSEFTKEDSLPIQTETELKTENKAQKTNKGLSLPERLEEQSRADEPLSVEDVKKATGFGDEGSKLVTEIANRDGVSFKQAKRTVENAYRLGLTDIETKKVKFDNNLQKRAFEAGKIDIEVQNRLKIAESKKASVYESGFTENEYSKKLTNAEKEMFSTLAKDLKMDIEFVDKIVAFYVDGKAKEANASHYDGKMRVSSTSQKPAVAVALHEGSHRMRQLDPESFNFLMKFLYETSEQNARRLKLGDKGISVFDKVRAEYREDSQMNSSDYIEEIAVRRAETILTSPELFNKWRAELDLNPQAKNAWQKFLDIIKEVLEDIWAIITNSKMSLENKRQAQKELELFENAYRGAMNAATERANEVQNNTKSSKNLEIKINDEYNGNKRYSLKSNYNEHNTIGMQWAYDSDTQVGDRRLLYNSYTNEYVLVEATKDGVGFIELGTGSYEQMKGDEKIYESSKQRDIDDDERAIDTAIYNFESGQNHNSWDNVDAGNRGKGIQNAEISKRKSESDGTTDTQATDGNLNQKNFSLKDSEGNMLTEAQQEYFKDSKVRDENGNLLVVYHGSPAKFTIFKHAYLNTHGNSHGRGFYFTENKSLAEGYNKEGGQLLKGYLNIENPLSEEKITIKKADLVKLIKATCKEEAQRLVEDDEYANVREALPNTWVSNYVETYRMRMDDVYTEVANIVYSGSDNDVDIIAELTNGGAGNEIVLKLTHDILGYDGVIYENDYGHHEFVSLVSNQFKSIDNANPTGNPDINFSLKDSEGNTLTEAQQEYFKDSKIRVSEVDGWKNTITEDGALFPVYHGTNSGEFYEFDESAIGSANDRGWFGRGFYFAFTESEASYYGNRVLKCYLNVKKPFMFSEEMMAFDGQESGTTNFDFAAFIINVADKFPKIAQNAYVEVTEHSSDYATKKSFTEFAKEIKDVYADDRLSVVEIDDRGKKIYQYRYLRDVDSIEAPENIKNIIKKHYVDSLWVAEWLNEKGTITDAEYDEIVELFDRYGSKQFNDLWLTGIYQTKEYAEKNRLSAVIQYLQEHKYRYIDQHSPVYYMMHLVGDSLTAELRKRGYDGIIQSRTGDEVVVFDSNQIKLTSNKNPTNNPNINLSLKDGVDVSPKRTTEYLDAVEDLQNGKKGASSKLAKYVESGDISTEIYEELIEKYGAIPSGERPYRDIQVPRKSGKNKKVSQTVRTILEARATPDEALPTIEKMVEDGVFSYDVYTDKKAIKDAEDYINGYGWIESYNDWMADVKKGIVSKQHTVMGWALYNNAVNTATNSTSESERKTAMETALAILDAMVKHQRNAAQALQATRVLKKLSPETQLYGVQKSVQTLQKELTERYGDKAPDLKIDEELAEQFLTATTEEERIEAEKEIYKDIGRQMPSRFIDKWNAWRYLAMLGNPRTHIRNIVGNAGFAPIVVAKDMTATAIESAVNRVSRKKIVRGKSIITGNKADRTLLKAAWGDYGNVADLISNGGKYNDSAMANQQIEEGRQIFKTKPLEWARKGNSKLLEKEDMWFAQPHYAYALAQYCKANNITAEQIKKGKAIAPAREYAIKEAQKATYRDTNAFSQMVSEWGRNRKETNVVKKAFNTVVEGIFPFRKTPANILVRGIEYSPIGLLKGLSYDLHQVSKGKMLATEAIDNISAGLTGTGLLALGIYLASQGLIRGHGEDDKEEKEFKELMGHQAYALELPNGQSITLDWLAPEALPLFVGVNIWESTKGSDEELNLSTILSSVRNISEPMLEMSCLQGINDLVESVGYASSNDTSGLVSILSSAVTSYLTQGIPTILGQAERTGEDVRMTTYTEKNDFLTGDMQYTIGKASAKIPFVDYHQIPYIDSWGRKESSGVALKRGLNNFLNPAYTSEIDTSKMEKELLRLYEKTGEDGVFPSRADKYFTVDGKRKDLTADEYVKYATLKGQKSHKIVSDLVKSDAYKKLSDDEKVKAIEEAYDYANQKAKQSISKYKPDAWVSKADEFGENVGSYISFKANVSGTKNENGGKISKEEVVDIILDMAQNDSETWKMYLSMYDSDKDMYAYNKGVSGITYMNFIESLSYVDQPTESGKYGTYTQEEAVNAILQLKGLSREERAILYQSVNTSWKNNPFR